MFRRASRNNTMSSPFGPYGEPPVLVESCATLRSEETGEDAGIHAEGLPQGYEGEKAELRKQVHAEAMAYKFTTSYLIKARLEEPVDEHTVLREQLRALECGERNGALLTPDELMFPERMFPREEENFPVFGAAAGGVQRGPLSTALSATGARLYPPLHVHPSTEMLAAYSGAFAHPPPSHPCTPIFSAVAAAAAQQLGPLGTATGVERRRRTKGEIRREDLSVPVPSSIISAYPAAEPVAFRSRLATLQKRLWKFTLRTKPPRLREAVLQQAQRQKQVELTQGGGELPAAFGSIRSVSPAQAAAAKSRTPIPSRGIALEVDAGVSSSPAPPAVHFHSLHDRELRPSVHALICADTVAAAEELEHLWRDAPASADATGISSRLQLTSNVGGEKHILNWREWLQRQRERGLYFTEGIYLLTVLGALNSSRCLGSLWYQLHSWQTPYFFVGYAMIFLFAGLPMVHAEMMLGNLYRGNVVKCFTQINPYFAGFGLAIAFSNFLSWQSPMPWELTPEDKVVCRQYQTQSECNSAYSGYLCAYSEDFDQCIPCPTGKLLLCGPCTRRIISSVDRFTIVCCVFRALGIYKSRNKVILQAAYYFLSTLEPELVGKGNPSAGMDVHYVYSLGLVCLLVLAHTWRGFFRLGFTSAILTFVGFLLWGTLVAVCVVGNPSDESFMTTARHAGGVRGGFVWANLGRVISASYTDILADLCVGCGVYQALSSYTKIGYNTVPGGTYISFIQAGISGAAFVAILGVLRSVEAHTGIPVSVLVLKTRNVAAHFSVYPAGFVNISAANVFSMFLYGGAFLLDTQMVAILFQTFVAVFQESRIAGPGYHWLMTIGVLLLVFLFAVSICFNAQFLANAFVLAVSVRVILPIVVLLESLVVGWYLNYTHQVRIAGGKATLIYFIVCGISLVTVAIVGAGTDNHRCWLVLAFPFINAFHAATVVFLTGPKSVTARVFSARFYALYFGNLDTFVTEVRRVTLYKSRFSWNIINWIASLLRGIFWCQPCATPSFCFRVSLVWAFCVKHLVPILSAHAVVNGVAQFSFSWQVPIVASGLHVVGLIVTCFGLFLTIVFPLIPRVGRWVCPPPEDYMPVKLFPSQPRPRVKTRSLAQRVKNVMLEFLWPEEKHSPSLSDFLHAVGKEQSLAQWESGKSRLCPAADTSVISASLSAALSGGVRRRGSFVALDAAQAAAARRHNIPIPLPRDTADREGLSRQRGKDGRAGGTAAAARAHGVPVTDSTIVPGGAAAAGGAVTAPRVAATTGIAAENEAQAVLAKKGVETLIAPQFHRASLTRGDQPLAQASAATSAAAEAADQQPQAAIQKQKERPASKAGEGNHGEGPAKVKPEAAEPRQDEAQKPSHENQVLSAQLATEVAALAAARAPQGTGDDESYTFEGYGENKGLDSLGAEAGAREGHYNGADEEGGEVGGGDGIHRSFLRRSETLSSVQSI